METAEQKMMLIIVTGLPGTGKTTFAKALSDTLGVAHLNTDMIRHEHNKLGKYDFETKKLIYQVLYQRTARFLAEGNSVIVDGTFYLAGLRKPFIHLADSHNCELIWIVIHADESVVEDRMQRKRSYSEADYDVYQIIKRQYEPLEHVDISLHSDGSTMPQMLDQTIQYLNRIKL